MFNKKEYDKKWVKDNPEKRKEVEKRCYKKYCEERKKYSKRYREDNPEKVKKQKEKYRKANYEKVNERQRKYRENNPEVIKEIKRRAHNKKRTDLKYVLNHRISKSIWRSLKGNKNGNKWTVLMDYDCDGLIKHLKKTMPEGYGWKDFLQGKLHIDHIIPISVFNFTKIEHTDFKRCWSLKNLRLLPAKENQSKGNKLTRPFQPALQIQE